MVALVASGDDVHVEALGELTHRRRTGAARLPVPDRLHHEADHRRRDDGTRRRGPALARRACPAAAPGTGVARACCGRWTARSTTPCRQRATITVRDLLTFTFGFGMHFGMFTAATPWPVVVAATEAQLATIGPPDPDAPPSADEWIKRLGALPLLAQPGERWLYNTGAQVLGVLCQRAAETSRFADVLRSRLLDPLGMSQTVVRGGRPGTTRDGVRQHAGRAHGLGSAAGQVVEAAGLRRRCRRLGVDGR